MTSNTRTRDLIIEFFDEQGAQPQSHAIKFKAMKG